MIPKVNLYSIHYFRDDVDYNYAEQIENAVNCEHGELAETIQTISGAFKNLPMVDQGLDEELRSHIGCGIGCAIQNVISNYCMVMKGGSEEDEMDGEVSYGSDYDNGELIFDIVAIQSFRINGRESLFSYAVAISEKDYEDDEYIENLLKDIREEVARQF
jgi:hypothetical protein